ncbi:MAG: hypothetical protein N838_11030 [Thiohalocapsa sp. PB-PSB1]|jgi:type IV pilus assembly protein PilE|nr:MAG: hypothetical protein N838_11030 [Thiohalocapsa sp. PB-PSB1]
MTSNNIAVNESQRRLSYWHDGPTMALSRPLRRICIQVTLKRSMAFSRQSPVRGLLKPSLAAGFTITELLIAVAILSILIAVALPSYQSHMLKARRNEGQSLLLDVAARQEQYYGDNRTFTEDMTQLGYAADPVISENGNYAIDAVAGTTNSIATSFLATATRIGKQLYDTACGDFTIDSDGRTRVVNYAGYDSDPPADAPINCW